MTPSRGRAIGGISITRTSVKATRTLDRRTGIHQSAGARLAVQSFEEAERPAVFEVDDKRPTRALESAVDWLFNTGRSKLEAIGVAGYGPFLSLTSGAPNYGIVSDQSRWAPLKGHNIDQIIRARFQKHGEIPRIVIQTDVAAAALGEMIARSYEDEPKVGASTAAQVAQTLVYLSFTEGVGGGFVHGIGDRIWNGAHHPEMGQIAVQRSPGDPFPGIGVHTKDCLEGMASTKALLARFENKHTLEQLCAQQRSSIWRFQADYTAQACATVTFILAPSQIVLGGLLFDKKDSLAKLLLEQTRSRFLTLMRGKAKRAFPSYERVERSDFIQLPGLDDAALVGTLCMAGRLLWEAEVRGLHAFKAKK